jgi:hypothetical protein
MNLSSPQQPQSEMPASTKFMVSSLINEVACHQFGGILPMPMDWVPVQFSLTLATMLNHIPLLQLESTFLAAINQGDGQLNYAWPGTASWLPPAQLDGRFETLTNCVVVALFTWSWDDSECPAACPACSHRLWSAGTIIFDWLQCIGDSSEPCACSAIHRRFAGGTKSDCHSAQSHMSGIRSCTTSAL